MAHYPLVLAAALLPLIAGCETAALAVLGGGASTILRYNLDGIASRTFTAPAAAVKSASLAALDRMGLAIDTMGKFETGEVIRARSPNREIEIELEPITEQATRVRVMARGASLFYDNATAVELVQQTEKLLEPTLTARTQASPSPSSPASPAAAAGASLPAKTF
ncbi:MAG: DUF3568 family protein [Burkholderiales bacterium]